jgi:hypothetical protein
MAVSEATSELSSGRVLCGLGVWSGRVQGAWLEDEM